MQKSRKEVRAERRRLFDEYDAARHAIDRCPDEPAGYRAAVRNLRARRALIHASRHPRGEALFMLEQVTDLTQWAFRQLEEALRSRVPSRWILWTHVHGQTQDEWIEVAELVDTLNTTVVGASTERGKGRS